MLLYTVLWRYFRSSAKIDAFAIGIVPVPEDPVFSIERYRSCVGTHYFITLAQRRKSAERPILIASGSHKKVLTVMDKTSWFKVPNVMNITLGECFITSHNVTITGSEASASSKVEVRVNMNHAKGRPQGINFDPLAIVQCCGSAAADARTKHN